MMLLECVTHTVLVELVHYMSNMIAVISNKGRTSWLSFWAFITRGCQQKKDTMSENETSETTENLDTSYENNAVDAQMVRTSRSSAIHVTQTTKRDTPCCSDTELIVNQLALLAASVSQSSASTTPRSTRSSSTPPSLVTTATTQSSSATDDQLAEEESFHYLRSLITTSSLPRHNSSHLPVSLSIQEEEASKPGRKHASSRLSIRLGDLPGLAFPSKRSKKPCPRYTTLPPIHSSKYVTVRPDVRF